MKDNENELSKEGDTFDSIYDTGNPNKLDAEECTNYAVACEIWKKLSAFYENSSWIDPAIDGKEAKDVLNELERKDGLIERIKKYLGVDLNKLDRDDDREKRERSKILYFFYMLEHSRDYCKIKPLMRLGKPSMENIDNTPLGWQTHNGKIMRTVKEALGKELTLYEKDRINSTIRNISLEWDEILHNTQYLLDFLYDYGFDYSSVVAFQSSAPFSASGNCNQEDTLQYPVAKLYLTLSQREYLGNLLDIMYINKIQNDNNYDVPPEFVEEMKALYKASVKVNNAEEYIKDNALRLSPYVYLCKDAAKDKENVRRIRSFAHKFQKFQEFFRRANCQLNIQDISNELMIVSFLQALILDNQSEVFDYIYPGYQDESKHMMRVNAALKGEANKRVPDALQIYWVRKVMDRWYANVGKYDVRLKMRQIEQECDEIREKILTQSTLDEMIAVHKYYLQYVDPTCSFGDVNQIQAVICVLKFLQDAGFEYIDPMCKIRFAFLNSKNCNNNCEKIISKIQVKIHNLDQSCPITIEPTGDTVRDIRNMGFFLELEFDYLKKTCVLTQFEPLLY